ncbi:sensor histidine kinase [Gracilibacillus phocaeensis]|uniref:sensor histidine kinase n=1 Tax=Gracilibacillus phocaeensis TaxID=2042304 RepID=UPI00102FD020|nr:HAMP domain-containing sensor histidine kinase [Gracilibacillus phocaeensis]
MIGFAIFLVGLCTVFIFLYYRQKKALKRLLEDIETKRLTETNLLLTSQTKNAEVNQLIHAFNQLFHELKVTKVASQQEQATLKLALHNITHDIRTPLTIANGYTQQLLRKQSNMQPTLQKVHGNIRIVADRLDILLEYQNLLEQSVQPVFQSVNLTELIKQELVLFYDTLNDRAFDVDVDLEQIITITCDPDLLKRIMQNLFGNVLKHGKDYLRIHINKTKEHVLIEVTNGEQHPIKNIEHLTTRFYSENMSNTENSSGLGLYIAKELTELTNGHMTIHELNDMFTVHLTWKNN